MSKHLNYIIAIYYSLIDYNLTQDRNTGKGGGVGGGFQSMHWPDYCDSSFLVKY